MYNVYQLLVELLTAFLIDGSFFSFIFSLYTGMTKHELLFSPVSPICLCMCVCVQNKQKL